MKIIKCCKRKSHSWFLNSEGWSSENTLCCWVTTATITMLTPYRTPSDTLSWTGRCSWARLNDCHLQEAGQRWILSCELLERDSRAAATRWEAFECSHKQWEKVALRVVYSLKFYRLAWFYFNVMISIQALLLIFSLNRFMNLWDDFMLHKKCPCLKFWAPISHSSAQVINGQVHQTGPNVLLLQTAADRTVL